MKTVTYIIAALALSLTAYQQFEINALKNFQEEVITNINLSKEFVKIVNDLAVERENALQDSLEERIGTLEREIEDLKYILGDKHVKQ